MSADLRTIHATRQQPLGGVETFSGPGRPRVATEAVPISTDDCGSVMLRFANGANGCLWVSQTTAGWKNCLRFEIAGAKQSLAWNSESPDELWVGHRDRANETLGRDQPRVTLAFFSIGTGVGGGVAIDGQLRLGPLGAAGELGHQTLMADGPRCGCGNRGCLEALASGPAIVVAPRALPKECG